MIVYTEEHELFRQSLADFIEREIAPYVDAWEAQRQFPARELYKKMGDEGFFGLTYPEDVGGLGLDYRYKIIWGEELGKIKCGGIPMSIAVHSDMCTPALAKYGSPELKEQFLRPAIYGEKIGAIAVTEPSGGSDIQNIQLTAREQGDLYILSGSKRYITNGGIADFVVTLCRSDSEDGGMLLLVVPTDTSGFSVSRTYDKIGNYTCSHAELTFDDVHVPKAYRIGAPGTGYDLQMEQFQHERMILGIIACSQSRRILSRAKAYAKERSAFGTPLIHKQHIAFTLAELDAELELIQQMANYCAWLFMNGKECLREVAILKWKSGSLLCRIADRCLQIFGGYGYMEDAEIIRAYRDTRAASIAGGTDEMMQYIVSRFL